MRATTVILTSVRIDEFSYELPPELIAQQPLGNRAGSRMLVVHRTSGQWEDRMFSELPHFIEPGDCLILNDSRVLPSRLFATRPSGPARIEVFLVKPITADQRTWQALVRPGRKVAVGEKLKFSESLAGVVLDRSEHGERTIQFETDGDLLAEIERVGHVPLPPYIRREDRAEDRERYQTVYADQTGSVAAPTAGLHFTPEILDHCRSAGANIARVTLHVGLGTFAPIHATEVDHVNLQFERYRVTEDNLDTIRAATRRIAVGTTSVRTVETVYANGKMSGETNLFISPGYRFRAIDAMLTNFHLPQSSLLMLVSAFAGRELALSAYQYAIEQRYRFFSYGDCMLIL